MPEEPGSVTVSTALEKLTPSIPAIPLRPPANSDFDIIACLSGGVKLIERVISRQLGQDTSAQPVSVQVEPTEDPIIDTLDRLVSSFKSGGSTQEIKAQIEQFLTARDERSELVNNLLVVHDVDRLPDYLKLRRHVEKYLLKSAFGGSLTPAEALAFLKIAQTEIDSITSQVRSGGHASKDVNELIRRADFVNKSDDKELAEKFKNTSPQGREILRKIGHKLAKAANAAK